MNFQKHRPANLTIFVSLCRSLCIWSGMKKKPLCVKEIAHGKSENGDANWISAIATMFNADVIASGKNRNADE